MTRLCVDIPVIETDRLILRKMRDADLDVIADFFADDRSAFVGGTKSRADSWRVIAGALGHWLLRGHGMWVVADRTTDQPIGGVGFLSPEGWDEPELGWHLYNGHEGKGYAFEAATAARAYGAAHFGLDGVISYIAPGNTRSAALAERLGATVERQGMLLGHDVNIYRHPKVGERNA